MVKTETKQQTEYYNLVFLLRGENNSDNKIKWDLLGEQLDKSLNKLI